MLDVKTGGIILETWNRCERSSGQKQQSWSTAREVLQNLLGVIRSSFQLSPAAVEH